MTIIIVCIEVVTLIWLFCCYALVIVLWHDQLHHVGSSCFGVVITRHALRYWRTIYATRMRSRSVWPKNECDIRTLVNFIKITDCSDATCILYTVFCRERVFISCTCVSSLPENYDITEYLLCGRFTCDKFNNEIFLSTPNKSLIK